MCMAEPEPFIVTNDQGFLTLVPEMRRRLEESDSPLVVVAVVGAYRTGKSFLLNRLMDRQAGFPLGSTVQSKTKGIWGLAETLESDAKVGGIKKLAVKYAERMGGQPHARWAKVDVLVALVADAAGDTTM